MEFYKNKNVLIPGGAGFIGTNLVLKLISLGARVTVLDNFMTGKRSNLAALNSNKLLRIVEADVVNPFEIDADIIFNLACPASPMHYQSHPIETLKTSVFGINNLLELCKKTGARLVQASTSEVYGDPHQHPQTESYWGNVNPTGPRACYDEGKRAAEALAMDFHRVHGVDLRIARIFNTYGPHMAANDGRVVSNFIVQALAGQDLTIYGDGGATRSFCYVSDMVDALLKLGAISDISGEIINLGNPGEFTILELAQKVIEFVGSQSKINHHSLPIDDPMMRKPDISKAKKLLEWQPKINLERGLELTVPYFMHLTEAKIIGTA